jgi:putative copper resistance protein D
MALDLQAAQHGATTLLNLAVAVVAGASMSSLWLAKGTSGWARTRGALLPGCAFAATLVALLATAALLWLESAAMAEVPLADAGPAVRSMLASTHFGLAWSVGCAALAAVVALGVALGKRRPHLAALAAMVGLAAFWYSRSMVSHAASEGDFSLPLLADWAHLGLTSLWAGEVVVAGLVTLACTGQLGEAGRRDRAAYVAALSSSATFALAGIFVTGLYGAWRNLGSIGAVFGNPYGDALLAKLVFVGAAAMLGGFNRFVVMPPWLANERSGRPASDSLPRRFRVVLLVEAAVLLVVLLVAAVLASTSPPGADI